MPPYVHRSTLLHRHFARSASILTARCAHSGPRTLPEFSLEGKCCIVTGASQGLGKQILGAYARSGAHGAAVDLSIDSAKESISSIADEAKSFGLEEPHLRAYECNTAHEEQVKETFARIVKDLRKIDIVVTNAGITGGAPVEEYPLDEWKQMLDVNVTGTFLFAREAGKYFLENKIDGRILMISSMSGTVVNVPQKQAAYNASKAASAHLMKSMATEWGPHGIRVNALSPGYIQTTVNEGDEMKEMSKQWLQHIPLRRIAKPDEFRGAAVWMVSDASSYLTGSEIIMDGGYVIV